jgi:hypothetical protein
MKISLKVVLLGMGGCFFSNPLSAAEAPPAVDATFYGYDFDLLPTLIEDSTDRTTFLYDIVKDQHPDKIEELPGGNGERIVLRTYSKLGETPICVVFIDGPFVDENTFRYPCEPSHVFGARPGFAALERLPDWPNYVRCVVLLSRNVKSIADRAFSITGVVELLQESGGGLERIEGMPFVGSSLQRIRIPETVNFVGSASLGYKLDVLEFEGRRSELGPVFDFHPCFDKLEFAVPPPDAAVPFDVQQIVQPLNVQLVIIPEGVRIIRSEALWNVCAKTIKIPASVEVIERSSFYYDLRRLVFAPNSMLRKMDASIVMETIFSDPPIYPGGESRCRVVRHDVEVITSDIERFKVFFPTATLVSIEDYMAKQEREKLEEERARQERLGARIVGLHQKIVDSFEEVPALFPPNVRSGIEYALMRPFENMITWRNEGLVNRAINHMNLAIQKVLDFGKIPPLLASSRSYHDWLVWHPGLQWLVWWYNQIGMGQVFLDDVLGKFSQPSKLNGKFFFDATTRKLMYSRGWGTGLNQVEARKLFAQAGCWYGKQIIDSNQPLDFQQDPETQPNELEMPLFTE